MTTPLLSNDTITTPLLNQDHPSVLQQQYPVAVSHPMDRSILEEDQGTEEEVHCSGLDEADVDISEELVVASEIVHCIPDDEVSVDDVADEREQCLPDDNVSVDDGFELTATSSSCSTLPTFKSQVDEELDDLPIATATALGTMQRAQVQRVIGRRRGRLGLHSSSSVSMSSDQVDWETLSLVVEDEEEQENRLRQCAHEARLRFKEAERQLLELHRAKRERQSAELQPVSVLVQPKRRSEIDWDVAQDLQQQLIEQDEQEQAATIQADQRLAEQLQQQQSSFQILDTTVEQNTSRLKDHQKAPSSSMLSKAIGSPNKKRRHRLRDLSRNLVHTRSFIGTSSSLLSNKPLAATKPRRTVETNQNEELWI